MAGSSGSFGACISQVRRPRRGVLGLLMVLAVAILIPQCSAAQPAHNAQAARTEALQTHAQSVAVMQPAMRRAPSTKTADEVTDLLSGDITLAVAANFLTPARRFAAAFKRQSGHGVTVVSGSTGKLYAQIRQGAPFDIFLAADTARPQLLIDAGYAVSGSQFVYAKGQLALLQPNADIVDANSLWRYPVRHIAVANPALAPYGIAALKVLSKLSEDRPLEMQPVLSDSVSGAFSLVASGNAQAGLVALSHLRAANIDTRQYWVVPTDLYAPIAQMAVLLNRAEHNATAKRFLNFLKSAQVQAQLPRLGYALTHTQE